MTELDSSSPQPEQPSADDVGPSSTRPRWRRVLLLIAGWVSFVLGCVGIVLPLLPTTPLILLAAFCFARGSEHAHRWLLRHRVFGAIVREWEEQGTIPPRVKWTAIALVVVAFGISALLVPNCAYGYVTFLVLAAVVIFIIARIPTQPRSANVEG